MKIFKYTGLTFLVLFIFYNIFGYIILPYTLTDIVPAKIVQNSNISLSLQKAKFNPYNFTLNIINAEINDKNNNKILHVNRFDIILKPLKLFEKSIEFKSIIVDKPSIFTSIDKNGTFNLQKIHFKTDEKNQTKTNNNWEVSIDILNIKNGLISLKNEKTNQTQIFESLNYEAKNISTKKGEISNQMLNTKSPNIKDITLDAKISLNPINTYGRVNIKSIKIEDFTKFGIQLSKIYPKNLILDINFDYNINKNNGLNIALKNLNLNLNNIKIYNNNEKFSDIKNISLNDFILNLNIKDKSKLIKLSNGRVKGEKIAIFENSTLPLNLTLSNFNLNKLDFNYNFKDTNLSLKNIDLKNANINFSKDLMPLKTSFTKLKLDDIDILLNKDFSLQTNNITSENIKIQNINQENSFLDIKSLHVKNPSVKNKIANIDKVDLEGVNFKISLEKNNTIDILKGFNFKNNNSDDKIEQNETRFSFKLNDFFIKNSNILFTDNTLNKPFIQNLNFSTNIKNISNKLNTDMDFSFNAKDSNSLDFSTNGTLHVKPLHVKNSFNLKHQNLNIFNPYLQNFLNIFIKKGSIDTKGNLTFHNEALMLSSDTKLDDFIIQDNHKQNLFQWQNLDIKDLNFNQNKQILSINQLLIDNSKTNIVIDKNANINLEHILPKTTRKTQNSKNKLDFNINNLHSKNSQINIINKNLPQTTSTNITSINAEIEQKKSKTNIDIKAIIDQYGFFQTNGNFNPKDIQNDTNLNFIAKNISLLNISAYSQKYIGYPLKNGTLSINSSQIIKNSKLNSKNDINLHKISLGKQEKNPLNIPLETALLLLKNSNNDIDLNIPISGNLKDPNFNFIAIFSSTFSKIITNIVTAPFSVLGNILGIDANVLKSVDFLPSSYEIPKSQEYKMDYYVDILKKRPNITLNIQGGYDKNADFIKNDENKTQKDFINLANKRAISIKQKLHSLGVLEEKIIIKNPLPSKMNEDKKIATQIGVN